MEERSASASRETNISYSRFFVSESEVLTVRLHFIHCYVNNQSEKTVQYATGSAFKQWKYHLFNSGKVNKISTSMFFSESTFLTEFHLFADVNRPF